MVVFLFLVVALVVVVGAVTLAVLGGGERDVLPEAAPERWADPLPGDRPVYRDDVEALRFPTAVRGYRMSDVDDALGRLGAELAERDARIAQLESAVRRRPAATAPPPGPGGYEPPYGDRAGQDR
jgi:DivIVA domain-containing protein